MKDYHLLLACDKYYLPYMFVVCQSVLNGIKNSQTSTQDNEQIIFNVINKWRKPLGLPSG